MIKPKLELMQHQIAALEFIGRREFYALLMEQGTGKTVVEVLDAARRWERGQVNGLLVLAPNGVQSNWVRRELPKHMPHGVAWSAAAWQAGASKRQKALVTAMFEAPAEQLHVFAMNWESLLTGEGRAAAHEFCQQFAGRLKISADESHNIKSPEAQRTKQAMELRRYSCARSIMSGSPILKGPWDAFSQFNFLQEGLLDTTSFVAFRAAYAELLPSTHGVLRHINMRKMPALIDRFKRQCGGDEARAKVMAEQFLEKYKPQIVAKDEETGLPKWRNLEKLEAKIALHSFRVLKKDCLNLPPKIYVERFFSMTAMQQKAYDKMRDEFRVQLTEDQETAVARLASMTKLSQIVSGFVKLPQTTEVKQLLPLEKNPKVAVLLTELHTCLDAGEQVIVWARFQQELADVAKVLAREKIPFVTYHGKTPDKLRQPAIDEFEAGRAKVFLSQQRAGGTGLTLIAPEAIATTMTVIYYSNTFALGDRIQSEDRAHRIGQEKSVRYVDILAEDSIDLAVASSLRNKQDVAALVTGDARRAATQLLNFQ